MSQATHNSLSRILGASLLIAGTSIGAGMLGLPMVTAAAGFIPSLALMLLCWVIMIFTALALVEVSRQYPLKSNFSELARLISRPAQWFVNCTYILFFYSLMAAYTSGGVGLLQDALASLEGIELSTFVVTTAFTLVFITVLYCGVQWVDRLNRVFMIGLIFSFLLLMWAVSPHVSAQELFNEGNYIYAGATLTIISTSFGFLHLMPSIRAYLKDNYGDIRKATVIGSFIPLCVYLAWEIAVIGSVPTYGANGLLTLTADTNGAVALVKTLGIAHHNPMVIFSVELFTILALLSSLVGVALGLSDYLKSALSLKSTAMMRVLLMCLTFGPGAVYAFVYPKGFLFALGNGGVFGAMLLIIFPAVLYLVRMKKAEGATCFKQCCAWGAILFGTIIIGAHIASINHWLPVFASYTMR